MIINLTKKNVISRSPVFATTLLMRGRGMIGRQFTEFDAMVFERCRSIHSLFMSIPLDVIFIDRENRICKIIEPLNPWVLMARSSKAVTVIEMMAGALKKCNAEVGDVIDLNAELSEGKNIKELDKSIIASAAEPIMPLNESVK